MTFKLTVVAAAVSNAAVVSVGDSVACPTRANGVARLGLLESTLS